MDRKKLKKFRRGFGVGFLSSLYAIGHTFMTMLGALLIIILLQETMDQMLPFGIRFATLFCSGIGTWFYRLLEFLEMHRRYHDERH